MNQNLTRRSKIVSRAIATSVDHMPCAAVSDISHILKTSLNHSDSRSPDTVMIAPNSVSDICRLQTADCRLQTADCRLQTADCRLQTADYRSQTAYSRPQTVDHKTLTGDLEDHRA